MVWFSVNFILYYLLLCINIIVLLIVLYFYLAGFMVWFSVILRNFKTWSIISHYKSVKIVIFIKYTLDKCVKCMAIVWFCWYDCKIINWIARFISFCWNDSCGILNMRYFNWIHLYIWMVYIIFFFKM